MHRGCHLEKTVQTSNMAAMTGKKCLNDCGLLLDRKAIVCSARLFVKSLVLTRSAYWSSGIPLSVVVSRDWCVQILGRKPASLSKRVLSKRVLLAFILVSRQTHPTVQA